MNGMTLRISSDKKMKPLKKDVEREDLQFLLSCHSFTDLSLFEKLLNAGTVEEQVKALKEVFNIVNNSNLITNELLLVTDVLVYLFVNLKQKSPLLQSFIKFFSTVPQSLKSDMQKCLSKHLYNKFLLKDMSFETIISYSFVLSTCLDNSCLSESTFLACAHVIFNFIRTSLKTCHDELMKEKAPIKKLLIINGIHGCVQASISLFQKYPASSEESLCWLAVDLLSDSELPLDTRAASGILAANISVNIDKTHWIKVYNFILESSNDLGMLSLCSGLLNILTPDDLESVININGVNKCGLYVLHDTIVSIEERKASESAIVLAATRCMFLVSRCYIKLPQLFAKVMDSFIVYIWGHIEHYMDAVRHLATSALSNIASMGATHPELGVFEAILKSISGMSLERRSKHAAILEIVSHVPVKEILSQTPGLLKALFSSALSSPSSSYALNSLEALIRQDLKEKADKVEWFELWVKPLLILPLSAPLEQLLSAVIKAYPPVLQHITFVGLDNNKNIDVVLTCLKIGRKFNLISGNDNVQTWKGLLAFNHLESCMFHCTDEIRLSCFSLLIETSKTTEEFTPIELNLIKTFFNYNFSTQDPAVRQKILASTKKLLTRLRDSQSSLQRRQLKINRSQVSSECLTYILDEYKKFLYGLKKTCLDSLFPGSSPSRRSLALGILAVMKQLNIYGDYDQKSSEILLSCLLDSYEDNKIIAKDLLSSYPMNVLNLMDQDHVSNYIKQTLMLSSSIRPPDSISAGYYMSLLASFPRIAEGQSVPQSTSYYCLTATLNALRHELLRAKESLLQAASSGPLYGHLFVIRHLLQGLDLVELGHNSKWCFLVKEIIDIAFECNNVVACIVYNSSPEGHIPMDFTYNERKKEGDPQVTSQMVLLCSWRTVKEVSLLLGELSERASIKEDDDFGLLTEEQILAIGDHLTGLLSETKHRGAFEQAYVGFSKLAGRLWKCYTGKLHELPKKWLDETLECILINEKLSATRRSAGIPFIVQGLICSELESGSCKSLHSAMSTLLKIAKEGSSESRLHALNILRALYRGSSLGEAVGPYVAEGIATAINGFNSNTWAERNSATLLLSALMSRVFGVPRGKSETLSWRNRMTGRLFFQRYPILYMELLSHLEASSKNHLYPALYPVLLLLGRLYPSSLEGTDSNLQLMKYVPFIMRCAESSVMKTRSLATTALASLITSASYESQIDELLKNISEVSHENHLHGYLLMVLKLIQQSVVLEDLNHEKIKLNINKWAEKMLMILSSPIHSCIVKDTCIQVIIHFVTNYHNEISPNTINSIKIILNDILFNSKIKSDYGHEVVLVHSSILLLLFNYKDKNISELKDNIAHLLESDEYDVVGVTSEFLEFIAGDQSTMFSPDTYDCFKLVLNDTKAKHEYKQVLINSELIGKILAEKLLVDKHQEDLVKLLLSFQFFPLAFQILCKKVNVIDFFYIKSQNAHRSVASYAISCINSYLSFENNEDVLKVSDVECIANLVDTHSLPEGDHQCRMATAELLSKHFYTLLKYSSDEFKLSLWVSAVRLVLDESPDVRNVICCGLVGNVLPLKALEQLLQKFVEETEDNMVKFIGLFFWAIGEPLVMDDIEEGTVFDKGNTNLNYEDLILNRLVCKHLSELCCSEAKSFLEINIDHKLSKWFMVRKNYKGQSCNELINNYKSSIDDCGDLNLLLPYRPLENQRILEKLKLHNILQALHLCL